MSAQSNSTTNTAASSNLELVHKGPYFTSYHFKPSGDTTRYLLKTISKENIEQKFRIQLNTEFEILQHLKSVSAVRRVLEKTEHQGSIALLLEYIDGKALQKAFQRPMQVSDFLKIAPAIAAVVGQIHQHKVIHKDIQPANILIENQTGAVKLIDFGISSRLSSENNTMRSLQLLEGHLDYISPEQTGRMNRLVDYRADLYSLGVVFYEMLTGRLPFVSDDPLVLIHSHIAIAPDMEGVPEHLDRIVAKLLAKNADDRYQSALGLQYDLEQCAGQLTKFGQLIAFSLGEKDYSHDFRLPQKLYGRSQETAALIGHFENVSKGSSHLLLIAGYSGIGKSALVHEVHKPITEKRGFFISGKYDQYQRNIPYFAFLKAFESLVQHLLTESETQRNSWKEKLLAALGANGQIVIDSIPNVEYLIGPQTPVAALLPTETQNRFFSTFLNFMEVFAQKEHPLVLFLDDLQWADAASLHLLRNLLLEKSIQHLLLIGAYRDNEVDATSPLMMTIAGLQEETSDISTIQLQALPPAEVRQLTADALRTTEEEVTDLSSLVFEKTAGNPFFLTQFLTKLYEDQLLRFDFNSFRWQWDTSAIRNRNISDNVVDLMTQKILRLPAETSNLLRIAACVGASFDLQTLAAAASQTELETANNLWPGIKEGLTPPLDDHYLAFQSEQAAADLTSLGLADLNPRYRFLHDRIQQAAYALIPVEERPKMHLHIGRLLMRDLSPEALDDRLFDIINHLNLGKHLISDPAEQEQCAKLNLTAGKKAKASTAHTSAADYLRCGTELLNAEAWNNDQYSLAYGLHYELAEALYLSGQHEEAERVLETILKNTTSRSDLAQVYLLKGVLYTNIGKLMDAFVACKEGLRLYETGVPEAVTPAMIGQGLGEIEVLKNGRAIGELIDTPTMTDPDKYMRKLLLTVIATPAYFLYNDTIWVWTVIQLVKTSMQDGNSDISDLSYSAFGVLLGPGLGDYLAGYEYGSLAVQLNKKFNKTENRAKVNLLFGSMISHWRVHVKQSLPLGLEGFQTGQETGDLIYAGYNAYAISWARFSIGRPLPEVVNECQKFRSFFSRTKDLLGQGIIVLQRMAEALQGLTTSPTSLENEGQDEQALIASILDYPLKLPIHVYYLAKMRLFYLFGEYEKILELVAPTQAVMYASTGYPYYSDLNFLQTLTLLALARDADPATKEAHLALVEKNLIQLKIWADNAPDNYQHKYFLIEAERLALTEDKRAASDAYDAAIELAHEHRFLHDEALINELAGRFYMGLGKSKLARPYLQDAYQLYLKWGAQAKADQLKELFAEQILTVSNTRGSNSGFHTKNSSGGSSEALDLYSIMKAYTAISGEVAVDKLLQRMITVILENSGAQRVVFLRPERSGQILVVAEGTSTQQNLFLWSEVLPMNSANHLLCVPIVEYTALTKTEVVVPNAMQDDRFSHTEYIKNNQPKSLLSLPILHQGVVMGIVYLENNLIYGAFTADRIKVLQLLTVQMAVSMENALLYRNMERKVQERTQIIHQQKEEIEIEKQKSEKLLFNILPVSIAGELRENGFATPKSFDSVTVLFTDFLGFTQVAERISPQELIETLNECFSAFDEIAMRHHLESIKTIGDAYMCAGGVPVGNTTHAFDAVRAALEIQAFIKGWNQRRCAEGKPDIQLRIGIHTGPVIAGVVGIRKFVYDIWGDAVNVASRMESSGEAGKINISGGTYEIVKNTFTCVHRGKIEAKNKGMIDMYFVEG